MRATWVVIGLVVASGTFGYVKLRSSSSTGASDAAKAPSPGVGPSLRRETPPQNGPRPGENPPATPSPAPATGSEDARAAAILETAAGGARRDDVLARLRSEAWDAPAARRYAVEQGWAARREAERAEGAERIRLLDEARRLLSRGVRLPDQFDADGAPTKEHATLTAAIQEMNGIVMRYAPGLPGVTRPYEVAPGTSPVQVVSREKLFTGHNAILYWNKAGNLDPGRLRAGETILLPIEELTVRVDLERRWLMLFIGDWFVKEFRVGVGRAEKPTPKGVFKVGNKEENPDWWSAKGLVRAGHPENELGSVWIEILNEENPRSAGYGLHGTNKAETVGTRCSNGCVRLANAQASELFWWVRTASGGGKATTVYIE
jgi:lipoprotein-anchoring transpeptidase ErfK/SrfK